MMYRLESFRWQLPNGKIHVHLPILSILLTSCIIYRCFGKGLDNTCPIGPVLVRPSELDGDALEFKGVLSGETVQASNTSYVAHKCSARTGAE